MEGRQDPPRRILVSIVAYLIMSLVCCPGNEEAKKQNQNQKDVIREDEGAKNK